MTTKTFRATIFQTYICSSASACFNGQRGSLDFARYVPNSLSSKCCDVRQPTYEYTAHIQTIFAIMRWKNTRREPPHSSNCRTSLTKGRKTWHRKSADRSGPTQVAHKWPTSGAGQVAQLEPHRIVAAESSSELEKSSINAILRKK